MNSGRPLRFLAMILGGWILIRIAMLWPAASPQRDAPVATTVAIAAASKLTPVSTGPRFADFASLPNRSASRRHEHHTPAVGRVSAATHPPSPMFVEAKQPAATTALDDTSVAFMPMPLPSTPLAHARSRLAGSAWAIGHGGVSSLPGGEIGGSQAGIRATYALGDGRHFALSARLYTPLAGIGRETAIGIDWQPTRAPFHVIAEQRIGLDGQRGGPTLLLVGGVNPKPIAAGFRLEAYAQAGVIARAGVEAFGDGAARLTRPLATIGSLKLDAGAGSWGAAQRGARRLDVGPTLGAFIPVAHINARVTLDWRERIGGRAHPGSGPAIAFGTDF